MTVIVSKVVTSPTPVDTTLFSSSYLRWSPEYRPYLFHNLRLVRVDTHKLLFDFAIPKLTSDNENALLGKLLSQECRLEHYLERSKQRTEQELFYRTAGGRYYKVFIDRPFGSESKSNKSKCFGSKYDRYAMIAVLSSDVWWWYYTLHFDMYNCKDYMIFGFPFDYGESGHVQELRRLGRELAEDLLDNAEQKVQRYASTGMRQQLIFKPSLSRPIIENIDRLLASHYNLTHEELDFIVNYDIKYRMDRDAEGADE